MDAVGQLPDFMSESRKSQVAGIVARAGQRLVRFIRARVANEADAEDIMQDVWQQLVAALEDGPIEHVAAWLYTVARNRITDEYRKPRMSSLDAAAEEMELIDDAPELVGPFLRNDTTPESEYLRHLFWEQLHAALAELPPEQRQVFVWHELEGFSFQQIAALTGENLNTLLSRKRYAVLHLRRHFQSFRDELFP